MDENKNVLRWGSEELAIPYYSPVDKKAHRYFPDFIAEIQRPDNSVETYVIEVKPKRQTKPPVRKKQKERTYIKECMTYSVNKEKWESAKKVCGKKGWKFIILTEDTILP
jgi:hypothetical protein